MPGPTALKVTLFRKAKAAPFIMPLPIKSKEVKSPQFVAPLYYFNLFKHILIQPRINKYSLQESDFLVSKIIEECKVTKKTHIFYALDRQNKQNGYLTFAYYNSINEMLAEYKK